MGAVGGAAATQAGVGSDCDSGSDVDRGLSFAQAALAEDSLEDLGERSPSGDRGEVGAGGIGKRGGVAAAALQDVSGFICPVCYATFESADALLAHHSTHGSAPLSDRESDDSSGGSNDAAAAAAREYISMRDLQIAGDLDALGDGPNSPLSSLSATPPDSPDALLRGLAASAQSLSESLGANSFAHF